MIVFVRPYFNCSLHKSLFFQLTVLRANTQFIDLRLFPYLFTVGSFYNQSLIMWDTTTVPLSQNLIVKLIEI